ncbi:MAG: virF [Frankiales bacterium]|nr:virF [Frankiales bacterium]
MTYLGDLRLERAHHQLAAAEAGSATATGVATRWGFTHLGRFARAYRAMVLGSPSDTLRSGGAASTSPNLSSCHASVNATSRQAS